jgi:hypothetical protein
VGLKVTLTVQVAVGASGLGLMGQVVVALKSLAFAPVMLGRLTSRFTAPALITVTLRGALVVKYACVPVNVILPGLTLMNGEAVTLAVPDHAEVRLGSVVGIPTFAPWSGPISGVQ